MRTHPMKALLSTICLLSSAFISAETVDVYILSGQSNMQGIGKLKNLGETFKKPRQNTFFWNGKNFEKLIPGKTKTSARKPDFGPEMGFSYMMEKMRPNRKIYLIKHYASGQPLHYGWNGNNWVNNKKAPNRWNFYPGDKQNSPKMGLHYRNLKNIFTAALNSLKKQKIDYQIKGFVWMQGEQDTKNPLSAKEYTKCLKQLKMMVEKDSNSPAPLPMVFGQVCPYTPARKRFTNRVELRQSQANAHYKSGHKDSIPGVFMVPTEGMPLLNDTVHYNAEGQIMLGMEFGLAMMQMQEEMKPKAKKNPVDK